MTPDLDAIDKLAEAATPGPWHGWHGDDDDAMNCYGVCSEPCSHERVDEATHAGHTIALTLLQQPRYADLSDNERYGTPEWHEAARWYENTRYIAAVDPQTWLATSAQARAAERLREALTVEVLDSIEAVRGHIRMCEGKHIQQVVYSTYHDALTQICWGERVIRTNAAALAGDLPRPNIVVSPKRW